MNVKNIINSFPHVNLDKIKSKIDKYDIVSFDVFDTLIKRDVVRENDVFDLVERLYNKENHSISGFKDNRLEAERLARLQSMDEEVTIEEIYIKVQEKYNLETANRLKLYEKQVEKRVCCANKIIMELYQYCLKRGKTILIISDMYWDINFITELLYQNGYVGYKEIFLSSNYRKQKQTGSLYNIVQEKYIGKSIIHIGDNKKSDYARAIQSGLSAVSIPKNSINNKYWKKSEHLDLNCIQAFISNRICDFKEDAFKVGYEVYGPLLYGFVRWLQSSLDTKKTTLLFARDCYIVNDALKILIGQNDKNIYFYGSRKSLIIPALYLDSSLSNVQRLIKSEPAKMTVRGFLEKVGLEPEKYKTELRDNGLLLESIVSRDELSNNAKFANFYASIESDIKIIAKKQYDAFLKYFTSFNPTKEIQVVDIGWRCTMQSCLESLLPNYAFNGYYLGVREDSFVAKDSCCGFYLDREDDFEKKAFLAAITALIEIFFSAPHGSVIGYEIDGTPITGKYECKDDPQSLKTVQELHAGALRFIHDFKDSLLSELICINNNDIMHALKSFGLEPDRKGINLLSDFPFHMGTGTIKAATPQPIFTYLIHPRKFMYDFSNSNWKIVFMKKLLHVSLPYFSLFKILYKVKL